MDVLSFLGDHLVTIIAVPAAGLSWLALNAIGKPLVTFRGHRMGVLRCIRKRQGLGLNASLQDREEADRQLRESENILQAYGDGAGFAVTWYCRLAGLDLKGAAASLRGLAHPMLLDAIADHQKLKADGVRACLGATRGMPPARVKEAREGAQRSVRALSAHYNLSVGQIQSPAMQTFGATLTRMQAVWDERWSLLEHFVASALAKKLDAIPREHINENPRPSVMIAAMAAIPRAHEEPVLQELWANLLASEMDARVAQGVLPSFVEIVNALSSDEARILDTIKTGDAVPIVRIQRKVFKEGRHIGGLDVEKNLSHIGIKSRCIYPKQTPAYLDNLARLRLIEFQAYGTSYHPSLYDELKKDPEIESLRLRYHQPPDFEAEYVPTGLELTEFGRSFIKACVDPQSDGGSQGRLSQSGWP